MKHVNVARRRGGFAVLAETGAVQAAVMVLGPGESSSQEVENEHPASQQWLVVLSGRGKARVGKRSIGLREGSVLLIEKREAHRITNSGRDKLVSVSFYVPPAYTKSGEVRPRARRRGG